MPRPLYAVVVQLRGTETSSLYTLRTRIAAAEGVHDELAEVCVWMGGCAHVCIPLMAALSSQCRAGSMWGLNAEDVSTNLSQTLLPIEYTSHHQLITTMSCLH